MFKFKLFLFISLFFSSFLSAIVYKIEVFKNENDNYVHLIYDIHTDGADLLETHKQQKELLEVIKKLNHSYLIAEDSTDLNPGILFKFKPVKVKSEVFTFMNKGEDRVINDKLKLNGKKYDSYLEVSICDDLMRNAKRIGISGYNAEFRQIVHASMSKKVNLSAASVIKNLDSFIDTLSKEVNESDNENLKDFCHLKFEEYYSKENLFRLKSIDSELSMCEMGLNYEDSMLDEDKSGLCCGIIDVNIINQIYKNRNKMNVFVCSGGWHMENVSRLMPALGYNLLSSVEGLEKEDKEGCIIVNSVDIGKFYAEFNQLANSPKLKRAKFN